MKMKLIPGSTGPPVSPEPCALPIYRQAILGLNLASWDKVYTAGR